ncbi:MAG: hypothetical protein KAY24_00320 [Candidatus Eisenbacteria sp.]|nr:hypothetical protein [Candidatus Eisenbacteria bacterium]
MKAAKSGSTRRRGVVASNLVQKTLATWNAPKGQVKATTDTRKNGLGLAIWLNCRLMGWNFTNVEKAQALVNELVGETVWA